MKRHVIIKANKFKPKLNIKIDNKNIVFFTFLICGLVMGVYISENGSDEWHSFYTNMLNSYLSLTENSSVVMTFLKLFLPFLLLVTISYFIGLCGVGAPLLTLIPVGLGVYLGVVVSGYYDNFGLQGIMCCALIYLPSYAIATATLIKCCCRCFDISGEIFFYLVSGKGEGKPILKEYTYNHLLFLLPIAIGSLVSSVAFRLFYHLFDFIK